MTGHASRAIAALGPGSIEHAQTFRHSCGAVPADVACRAAGGFPAGFLIVALLAGCASEAPGPGSTTEASTNGARPVPADAPQSDEHDWFADRAAAAGLDFVHFNGMSGEFYFPEIVPAGVASSTTTTTATSTPTSCRDG